jgi:hypothetical protein
VKKVIYQQVYSFAAKLGALEGYVYPKEMEERYLLRWVEHLLEEYLELPLNVRKEIQGLCDGTAGRAVHSLLPKLGEGDEVIRKLMGMIVGKPPSSTDDFFHGR